MSLVTDDVMAPRAALASELDALATVWLDAWRDAHEAIAPPALTRLRTWESFRARLADALEQTRVVGPPNEPLGFCIVKDDELYQLFVAAAARGTKVAVNLIDDAEARLANAGVRTAWLACAIGNDRAARFYEKRGWRRVGALRYKLDGVNGDMQFDVWRYEKDLPVRSIA